MRLRFAFSLLLAASTQLHAQPVPGVVRIYEKDRAFAEDTRKGGLSMYALTMRIEAADTVLTDAQKATIDDFMASIGRRCVDGWTRNLGGLVIYRVDLYGPKDNERDLINARIDAMREHLDKYGLGLWLGSSIEAVNKRDDPQWDGVQKIDLTLLGQTCKWRPTPPMPYH